MLHSSRRSVAAYRTNPPRLVRTAHRPDPVLCRPGARSLPFPTLLEAGAYKPVAALEAAFRAAGLDPGKPVVGSCGSGLTACILALALYQINGKLVGSGFWVFTAGFQVLGFRFWRLGFEVQCSKRCSCAPLSWHWKAAVVVAAAVVVVVLTVLV